MSIGRRRWASRRVATDRPPTHALHPRARRSRSRRTLARARSNRSVAGASSPRRPLRAGRAREPAHRRRAGAHRRGQGTRARHAAPARSAAPARVHELRAPRPRADAGDRHESAAAHADAPARREAARAPAAPPTRRRRPRPSGRATSSGRPAPPRRWCSTISTRSTVSSTWRARRCDCCRTSSAPRSRCTASARDDRPTCCARRSRSRAWPRTRCACGPCARRWSRS